MPNSRSDSAAVAPGSGQDARVISGSSCPGSNAGASASGRTEHVDSASDTSERPWFAASYPLRAHNTFGFDVRARYACRIEREDDVMAALRDPRAAGLRVLVLGGGSNIVFTRDFDGLVLLVALRGRRVVDGARGVHNMHNEHDARGAHEDDAFHYVEAAAGETWHDFVAWTLAQHMPGLENLALIPGTVGAAPVQNIGAYGLEMAQYCASVRAIELAEPAGENAGNIVEFDAAACRFGYRDSFFKREGRDRFLIVSVTFRLPRRWTPRTGYADLARALAARGDAGRAEVAGTTGTADLVGGVSNTSNGPDASNAFSNILDISAVSNVSGIPVTLGAPDMSDTMDTSDTPGILGTPDAFSASGTSAVPASSAAHAALSTTPSSPDAWAIFDAVVAVRRAKLPDPRALGNAGSFFKNPVVDAAQFAALAAREPGIVSYPQPDGRVKLAAGWLIDQCGWKGRALGAAAVHERQALVLVNLGGARGADVLALAQAIRADVRARFGVELEQEPVSL